MPTLKQKLAASKLSENIQNGKAVKPMGQILKEVGYSDSVSKHPDRVTKTKAWPLLMEKYLPDENLLQVHKELLQNPDWRARDAGLDKAYRLKGKLGTGSHDPEDNASQEIREVIFRIRRLLPSSEI